MTDPTQTPGIGEYHPDSQAIQSAIRVAASIREEVCKVVIGQRRVVDEVLVALLAGGHVIIEGLPGLGKTLTVRALAKTFGGKT